MKTRTLIMLSLLIVLLGCLQKPSETGTAQLAKPSETEYLTGDKVFQLEAVEVEQQIDGKELARFAYNGQIPGPLLKAKQNSKAFINFTNGLNVPTTVHWHGIRLRAEHDGVPDISQELVLPGESYLYELDFPDDGVYWYHPHVREDLQQELGLYGNILVEPANDSLYNRVDREEALIIDDIRLSEEGIEEFDSEKANYVLMGRFGDTMLVNGVANYSLEVQSGQIVRFYLTDAANARMFNLSITNATLKVVGGDSGLYDKEFFSKNTILAPGERAVVEVLFDTPGTFQLVHTTPKKRYVLGNITVMGESKKDNFTLRERSTFSKDTIALAQAYLAKSPDFAIDLTIEMPQMQGHVMQPLGADEPIEWEDEMGPTNALATSKNTRWILRDKKSGKENEDIVYEVKKGERKKIRFFNDPKSMHPMQHPLHIHGQRFLVLSENGKKNVNLVWKDVVTVPVGSTVDILVEFSNPGDWVFHCHISEHLESGMMGMFKVLE